MMDLARRGVSRTTGSSVGTASSLDVGSESVTGSVSGSVVLDKNQMFHPATKNPKREAV